RQKQSEYRLQLREKQKARRYYGVLENQFRNYYDRASRQSGVTGENLLRLLESRFDNVLVRLGFAGSRRQARQLILHGHWLINGRRVNIPSYHVRPNDVIAMRAGSGAADAVREATDLVSVVPAWLQADHDGLTAKVLRHPERGEISVPVQEQLIVELYSK
ncbi:MAG: 30S ribosomal protein S4, partial [Actinomycetota bacterium]|nr:30S ribosomal protein S4 [Actinomycetota bacterium]